VHYLLWARWIYIRRGGKVIFNKKDMIDNNIPHGYEEPENDIDSPFILVNHDIKVLEEEEYYFAQYENCVFPLGDTSDFKGFLHKKPVSADKFEKEILLKYWASEFIYELGKQSYRNEIVTTATVKE